MRTGRSMPCLPQSQRKGNCDMQMSKLHVYLPSSTTQTFSEWSISLMFLIPDPSFMSIPVRPGALILILLLWHHVPMTNWSPIQRPSFKSLIHSLCCLLLFPSWDSPLLHLGFSSLHLPKTQLCTLPKTQLSVHPGENLFHPVASLRHLWDQTFSVQASALHFQLSPGHFLWLTHGHPKFSVKPDASSISPSPSPVSTFVDGTTENYQTFIFFGSCL